MNVFHFWGSVGGAELVSANGVPLDPVPAHTGNLWQRLSLILLQHEFPDRLPVHYCLLARFLPAGRAIPPDALPQLFDPVVVPDNHGGVIELPQRVDELTSEDLAGAVARAADYESQKSAVDDAMLVGLIPGPDFRLANYLLESGVMPGPDCVAALADAYRSPPESSLCRRAMLRALLRGGLDLRCKTGGKTLLHHLCAGTAPAQDIRVVLAGLGAAAQDAINISDETGETPLLGYCRRRQGLQPPNRAGLTCLLDAGADPNAADTDETPYALLHPSRPDLAEILLNYGVVR